MALIIDIEKGYQELYNNMVIRPEWEIKAMAAAKRILAGRDKYQVLCDRLNKKMPWYFVGIIHMLECDCNFSKHLHNGDSLLKRTWQVPAGRPVADPWNGRGKPYTWLESAMDALSMPGKSFHVQVRWNLNIMLYRLEKYNGTGYIRKGVYTPYLWSGTEFYTKGKFVKDSVFDANAVSSQVGAALLLRYLTDKTLPVV